MLRKILVLMIVVGAIAGFASYGSALFTDDKEVDENEFTAGTVVLTTDEDTQLVVFDQMAPGDKVTAPITVSNDGTLALRYALTSEATNGDGLGLMSQLDMTIKTGVAECTSEEFGTDGTVIYGPAALGSVAGLNILGDPEEGSDVGDRVLAANADEVLCFQVSLPIDSDDDYQAATTNATFEFVAEQTANNP